jgi:hypothetical protein
MSKQGHIAPECPNRYEQKSIKSENEEKQSQAENQYGLVLKAAYQPHI